ncbi:ABC transporter substrate-binding protein [Paenibacillus thermoaerophilus]|uniref:ABC transporter substrate-binding protein n=1 Tax=Paenibacillus thermoaerophilus TaxID=1215385 RepID=A0ABW2V419_9BACL|nr:ABC transporter substrate-binding protein [Paenibacillus thermoaerophilus]TMV06699.1 ABC transporter substrate-binding protein [Paenibacillus thermoaerophilus]
MQRLWKVALATALAVSLWGCGAGGDEQQGSSAQPSPTAGTAASAQPSAPAKKTAYPLKVTDATGKEFTFDKAPTKVVSTSPAETEALFALGLGDKVVGVSDFDNYPEEAKSKPKMGSIVQPNSEAILGTGADLVLTGISMKQPAVEQLRALGIPLYKFEAKSLDDVMANLLTLGQIFDVQDQAEAVVAQMKADVQKVKDAVAGVKEDQKKKVYIEFAPGWTVGQGEFMHELIGLAGAVNVAGNTTGWTQISEEAIIQSNPDVILFANGVTDYQSGKALKEIIESRAGWDHVTAIRNKAIFGLDQDMLSRPGPRLTKGLVDMAKAIYPELVK